MSWKVWQPQFIQHMLMVKRCSKNTIIAYDNDLSQLATYLASAYDWVDDPSIIKQYHLRSWMAMLKVDGKCTATTLNRKRSSVLSFYKYLMQQGHVEANPAKLLHPQKKPAALPKVLRQEEAKKLLDNVGDAVHDFKSATDALILELLYNCGLRKAELMTLSEQDVEHSHSQLRVLGKGNKERLMPLSKAMLAMLVGYIALKKKEFAEPNREALLVVNSGEQLYPNYVQRIMKTHLAAVNTNPKLSTHTMRHSFATHLLENGASIQAIKELLGHSSLAATQIYTHTNIGQLKDLHRSKHPRG